jgi:hypothetical protein
MQVSRAEPVKPSHEPVPLVAPVLLPLPEPLVAPLADPVLLPVPLADPVLLPFPDPLLLPLVSPLAEPVADPLALPLADPPMVPPVVSAASENVERPSETAATAMSNCCFFIVETPSVCEIRDGFARTLS